MIDNIISSMLVLNWWVATGILILEIILGIHILIYLGLSFGSKEFSEKLKSSLISNWNAKVSFLKVETIEKYLIWFFFFFSLFTSIMTLVYSEIFMQIPCSLCWFQRIFMYGIALLSGSALVQGLTPNPSPEERGESAHIQKFQLRNVLIFSIFGALFALYQHAEQMLADYGTTLPCPSSGGDCAKRIIFEYGHITFPWMAFIIFTFFIVIILLQRKLR